MVEKNCLDTNLKEYPSYQRKNLVSHLAILDPNDITFTSPLPRKRGSRLQQQGKDDDTISPVHATEIVVTTPPTPDSTSRCLTYKPSQLSIGYGGSLTKLIARCRLSVALGNSIQRLGWISEQLLFSPLQSIAKTLSEVEFKCNEIEWQQLESLRDSFLRTAIAHLEGALCLYNANSLLLSASTMAILAQFHSVAQHILIQQPSTISNTDVSKQFNPFTNTISSTPPQNNESCSRPTNSIISTASKVDEDNHMTRNSQLEINTSLESSSVLIDSPLSKRQLKLVRKETVLRLQQILNKPQCIENDNGVINAIVCYTAPVCRHAQQCLGDLWELMEEIGTGEQFIAAATRGEGKRKKILTTSLSNNFTLFSTLSESAKKWENQKKFGALDLMGSRSIRRGTYVSRKTITNKSKRTRDKNLRQAEHLREKQLPLNFHMTTAADDMRQETTHETTLLQDVKDSHQHEETLGATTIDDINHSMLL